VTHEFDCLAAVYRKACDGKRYAPMAEWLADICVEQADAKMPRDAFQEFVRVMTQNYPEPQLKLKFDFLGMWAHGRAHRMDNGHQFFTQATNALITIANDVAYPGNSWRVDSATGIPPNNDYRWETVLVEFPDAREKLAVFVKEARA
jgi:hypothetical protein